MTEGPSILGRGSSSEIVMPDWLQVKKKPQSPTWDREWLCNWVSEPTRRMAQVTKMIGNIQQTMRRKRPGGDRG
ncbi:MAG TPA: hypothetical protein VFE47_09260 [Tepidisphaeraceae bacterium]|jgi:hypothetical protein|nr:hypothetical protein [Tepidisphaeraceae bacterium]